MDEVTTLFSRLCYVFSASGVTDLKVGMCRETPPALSTVFFIQRSSPHPHPRNGFYCMDADAERYKANMAVFDGVMKAASPPRVSDAVSISTVEAFLSVANCNRALLERRDAGAVELAEFERVHRLYTNSILLTRDESALQMLDIIERRAKSVTFCSTDDEFSNLVPEPLRMLVAEGFAGLALVAYYRKSVSQVRFGWGGARARLFCLKRSLVLQCISYATSSLFKHRCALPFVNCIRLVALARDDHPTVVALTEMVLLPFYLRCADPALRALYSKELAIWGPALGAKLACLPAQLVHTSNGLTGRFAGQRAVVRARFVDDRFVEKICAVCGKGARGEKLSRCGGCSKVYYCGRACQLVDWGRHKKEDGCCGGGR